MKELCWNKKQSLFRNWMFRVLHSPLFCKDNRKRKELHKHFASPFPGPRFKALWWGKSRWQMQRDSKLLTHSFSIMLWSAKEFRPNLNHESFVRVRLQFTRPMECYSYIFKECIFFRSSDLRQDNKFWKQYMFMTSAMFMYLVILLSVCSYNPYNLHFF